MKRFFIIALVVLAAMTGNNAMAQKAKFGNVDYAAIMQATPDWTAAQTELQALKDTLTQEGEMLQAEFQKAYEDFQKKQPTYSEAVAKVKQKDLEDMYKRLQSFAESAQSQLDTKEAALLEPIQTKVLNAIKEVAKANNYTYVFDVSTQLYNSENDDLTTKVKEHLGIK